MEVTQHLLPQSAPRSINPRCREGAGVRVVTTGRPLAPDVEASDAGHAVTVVALATKVEESPPAAEHIIGGGPHGGTSITPSSWPYHWWSLTKTLLCRHGKRGRRSLALA
jgi:hypothetical protein